METILPALRRIERPGDRTAPLAERMLRLPGTVALGHLSLRELDAVLNAAAAVPATD